MIYIVSILLLVGGWQLFMRGRKFEMISGASLWLAVILLVGGLAFGKIEVDIKSIAIIGLINAIIIIYVIRRFVFGENLRIREIIYTYREFKESNPNFNEDQLCRLTVYGILKKYYWLYNLKDSSDKEVKLYMDDLFKKQLNLKYICMWFMEAEYPKYIMMDNSHNLNSWRVRNKKLEERVDCCINRMLNL